MSGAAFRKAILTGLYGVPGKAVAGRVEQALAAHAPTRQTPSGPWSQKDTWLITYADQVRSAGEAPLRTLDRFLEKHLDGWLNGVHVLPFYPWSSDDGFSVTDYTTVDPAYGTWADIEKLGASRRLIVDAVVNHMSAGSAWFQSFLREEPGFSRLFLTADPSSDLSAVVRPRTSPLLTRFQRDSGDAWVWTTFSADQVDLDYHDPQTLIKVLEVLLEYGRRGARVIRLDAIAFLWKEPGTSCLHLPQTHRVIQFLRSCFDATYPDLLLLTETNVPHAENISYFGDATHPEAQIVYQFPLAPLVLDTFRTGDATFLSDWVADSEPGRPGTTFLNFLASHDGVGVRPAEGLLPLDRVSALAELSRQAGGKVGSRSLPDGSEVPYELNCTWFDLLADGYDEAMAIRRHLASHAVMLAVRGIPALYVHSLFGSSNDRPGFLATGRARSLNRHKFANVAALEKVLADPTTRGHRVLAGLRAMLALRRSHAAFHPDAEQTVVPAPPQIFAIDRTTVGGSRARVLVNCSDATVPVGDLTAGGRPLDGRPVPATLSAWNSVWLEW